MRSTSWSCPPTVAAPSRGRCPDNRALCRGVIASGNTNFGQAYCLAGDIIASKLGVPFLYRYELLGTPTDVARVKEGLEDFWQTR